MNKGNNGEGGLSGEGDGRVGQGEIWDMNKKIVRAFVKAAWKVPFSKIPKKHLIKGFNWMGLERWHNG